MNEFGEKVETKKTNLSSLTKWWRRLRPVGGEQDKSSNNPNSEVSLARENLKDPNTMIIEWVKDQKGRGIVALGESNHHAEGNLRYQVEMIEQLHQKYPIKTVFLEEHISYQAAVDNFMKSGKMDTELENYLKHGFVRGDSTGHNYKVELLAKCQELGIGIQFIDPEKQPVDRDDVWFNLISKEIGDNVDDLYVLIAGRTHVKRDSSSKFKKRLPSVVERLDKKYSAKTLSILSSCIDDPEDILNTGETFELSLWSNAMRLGLLDRSVAIKIAGSDYEAWNLTDYNDFRVSDFDIAVHTPGKNLAIT